MSDPQQTIPDILSAARRYNMFHEGCVVLAAVSGGADSVAMLHSLHLLTMQQHFTLHCCHVNHMLRERTADRDEEFVTVLCNKLNIPCHIKRVNVRSMLNGTCGVEETARIARYRALEDTAARIDANLIAIAHTSDDVIETLLFNLIRGTGIDGLGSIRPIRGQIVRPLIEASRADVERYLQAYSLEHITDETNADFTYSRNRIRGELLPYLESEFNPSVRSALLRLSEVALRTQAFIDESVQTALNEVSVEDAVSVERLSKYSEAVVYEVVRHLIADAKGDYQDIGLNDVKRIVVALESAENFRITLLTGRIEAVRVGDRFLCRQIPVYDFASYELELPVPGCIVIPEIGHRISAELVTMPDNLKVDRDQALINPDRLVGNLVVRNVKAGDKIVPFGMKGSKKLQDIFVDSHIPYEQRWSWPVITDSEKVVWVPNLVATDLVRVDRSCKMVVRLVDHIKKDKTQEI